MSARHSPSPGGRWSRRGSVDGGGQAVSRVARPPSRPCSTRHCRRAPTAPCGPKLSGVAPCRRSSSGPCRRVAVWNVSAPNRGAVNAMRSTLSTSRLIAAMSRVTSTWRPGRDADDLGDVGGVELQGVWPAPPSTVSAAAGFRRKCGGRRRLRRSAGAPSMMSSPRPPSSCRRRRRRIWCRTAGREATVLMTLGLTRSGCDLGVVAAGEDAHGLKSLVRCGEKKGARAGVGTPRRAEQIRRGVWGRWTTGGGVAPTWRRRPSA